MSELNINKPSIKRLKSSVVDLNATKKEIEKLKIRVARLEKEVVILKARK